MILFAPQLVQFFDAAAHPLVIDAGSSFIRIHGFGQIFIALGIVGSGALRGAGDTMTALVAAVIGRAVIVLPLAYLFGVTLNYGLPGIWWAIIVGSIVQAVIVMTRWRGTAWIAIALHRSVVFQEHLRHLSQGLQQKFVDEVRTPFMSTQDMQEFVRKDHVLYEGQAGKYKVEFAENNYQVTAVGASD